MAEREKGCLLNSETVSLLLHPSLCSEKQLLMRLQISVYDKKDFVQQYKSTDDFFLVFFNSTPLIIIGTETFEKMIEYGLSGFHCTNVYE